MNHHGIDTATLANVNARAASVSTGHKMKTRSQTKRQAAEEAAKRVAEEEAAEATHLATHVQGAECAQCVAEEMEAQRALGELWEPHSEDFEPWVFGHRMMVIKRNNAM